MELEKFVSETLLAISQGIRETNTLIKSASDQSDAKNTFFLKAGGNQETATGIDFDIAVTTTSDRNGQAGTKVKLAVVEAEIGGGGAVKLENVSRIKFKVYVGQWVG